MSKKKWIEAGEILLGVLIAIATDIIAAITYLFLFFFFNSDARWGQIFPIISFNLFLGIGFFQLIHIIPILFWLRRKRKFKVAKGMMIGAILIGLIGGIFFFFFFYPANSYFFPREMRSFFLN